MMSYCEMESKLNIACRYGNNIEDFNIVKYNMNSNCFNNIHIQSLCENAHPEAVNIVKELYKQNRVKNDCHYYLASNTNTEIISILEKEIFNMCEANIAHLCNNKNDEIIRFLINNHQSLVEKYNSLEYDSLERVWRPSDFGILFALGKSTTHDAINFIEQHPNHTHPTIITRLCRNTSSRAIDIVERNFDKLGGNKYEALCGLSCNINTKAIHLLEKHFEKHMNTLSEICLEKILENLCKSKNTEAIKIVEKHFDILSDIALGYLYNNKQNSSAVDLVNATKYSGCYCNLPY